MRRRRDHYDLARWLPVEEIGWRNSGRSLSPVHPLVGGSGCAGLGLAGRAIRGQHGEINDGGRSLRAGNWRLGIRTDVDQRRKVHAVAV